MSNYLITPTPQQLLVLMIFCVPIFGIMIYLVSGIFEVVMSLFLGLRLIFLLIRFNEMKK